MSAVPKPDPRMRGGRIVLEGDVADRWSAAVWSRPHCAVAPGHLARCHRAEELKLSGIGRPA